jgi:hypothetical protein
MKEEKTEEQIKKEKEKMWLGAIIISLGLVGVLAIVIFVIIPTRKIDENVTINSSCLREKVFLFVTTSCPACLEQVDLLEKANLSVFVMYCDQELEVNDTGKIKTMVEVCRKYGVIKVPSFWVYNMREKFTFKQNWCKMLGWPESGVCKNVSKEGVLDDKGHLIVGYKTLSQIKEISGC